MSQEYSFTLTVPLTECTVAESLLEEAKKRFPYIRVSRKTDRKNYARFLANVDQFCKVKQLLKG